MKNYIDPKMEISMFSECGIITTSGTDTTSNLLDGNTTYANTVKVPFADAAATYKKMNN